MPERSACQGEPIGDRPRSSSEKDEGFRLTRVNSRCRRLLLPLLFLLMSAFWQAPIRAQTTDKDRDVDIGIVIDNRPLPRRADAPADVDALITMIDRQMFIEHVMVLERPTIEVICDVFGCPEDIDPNPRFPPLLWQITREGKARLFVYYIGDGRAEGVERQLLFPRREGGADGDVVGLSVSWLHAMLKDVGPESAVLMLDTAFTPRPLPCAHEDPRLIDEKLLDIRRNYLRISRDRWNRTDNIELAATTPVQPAHCDRFDQVLSAIDQPMFTKFILKGVVDGEADEEPFGDEDGLIEHGELADYLGDFISRAARFQWGRQQNVRAVGSRSRVLASVDPRDPRPETEDLITRRNRPPATAPDPRPGTGPDRSPENSSDAGEGDELVLPEEVEPRCGEDPTADDCHPCVLDPGGAACTEHCQEETGSDFCARFLTSSTETGADMADSGESISGESGTGSVEVVPLFEGDDQRSAACGIAVDYIAPYASTLVERIRGDVEPSCAWAEDRSAVERGPFAQIFTPIGWRLGREYTQDMVHCLLDCDGLAASTSENQVAEALEPVGPIEAAASVRTDVDPRTLSAFNRHVCDRLHEPLPAYIGIPRWMPGTLMVSEALRAGYGCPLPATEPALPMPLAVAIAPPPERETPERVAPDMPGDREPAVAAADDQLATWPPYAADVDIPPGRGETPSLETLSPEIETAPDVEIGPDVETADAGSVPVGNRSNGATSSAASREAPFDATEGKVHWLQSALTVDNHNPGPIDGALGPQTMTAVQSWRRDNDRGDWTGELTEPEFKEIIEAFGNRFHQVQPRIGAF